MHRLFNIAAVALLLTLLFAGCHRKPDAEASHGGVAEVAKPTLLSFDSVVFHSHPDGVPSLAIDVSLALPAADPSNPVSRLLRRNVLTDALGERFVTSAYSTDDALVAYVNSLQAEFDKAMEECDLDDGDLGDGSDYMFLWENELSTTVSNYSNPILVCKTTGYSYEGGAHGLGGDRYNVYSTVTGMPQRLADVFEPSSLQAVARLMRDELGRMIPDSEIGDFSIDEVRPVENFNVTPDGITFVFNPYEIAAYSYGVIEISLPAAEVRRYIRAESAVAAYFAQLDGDAPAVALTANH